MPSAVENLVHHLPACCLSPCRGEEASGAELAALQERALWDLLSLFFLESGSGAHALVAQVGV